MLPLPQGFVSPAVLALAFLWLQSHLRHAHRAAHHAGVLHPAGAVKKQDKAGCRCRKSQLSDAGVRGVGDRGGDKGMLQATAPAARACRGHA